MLEAVCLQAAARGELGLLPWVAFNASSRELGDDGYAGRVCAALERHALAPGQMLIEVSEAAMHEYDGTRRVLGRLHELAWCWRSTRGEAGGEAAGRDRGTEYSSFTRLRELPVQMLKVDRSFLHAAR